MLWGHQHEKENKILLTEHHNLHVLSRSKIRSDQWSMFPWMQQHGEQSLMTCNREHWLQTKCPTDMSQSDTFSRHQLLFVSLWSVHDMYVLFFFCFSTHNSTTSGFKRTLTQSRCRYRSLDLDRNPQAQNNNGSATTNVTLHVTFVCFLGRNPRFCF